jgi:preprotein translocase subunit SecF
VQPFGNEREFAIKAADRTLREQQEAGAEIVVTRITDLLRDRFGADNVKINFSGAISPRVGSELTRGAFIAVCLSMLVVLAYLAWRFEWRFGVAAVVATMHDVVATIAFIKLMNLEVSLTVVAGILTVLGYSLNDTIIIFDRVRENLRKKRKESLYDTLNRSVNETLPRSVMTHGTTAAATMALLLFSGPVLRPFAWVMTFGILTGTLSSIAIASPSLLWIERRWPRTPGDKARSAGPISREALRSAPKAGAPG